MQKALLITANGSVPIRRNPNPNPNPNFDETGRHPAKWANGMTAHRKKA